MESMAQYRRPVWEALEQHWLPRRRAREAASRLSGTLHLAQAQSNRGPGGRKQDFPDAERLVGAVAVASVWLGRGGWFGRGRAMGSRQRVREG